MATWTEKGSHKEVQEKILHKKWVKKESKEAKEEEFIAMFLLF